MKKLIVLSATLLSLNTMIATADDVVTTPGRYEYQQQQQRDDAWKQDRESRQANASEQSGQGRGQGRGQGGGRSGSSSEGNSYGHGGGQGRGQGRGYSQ